MRKICVILVLMMLFGLTVQASENVTIDYDNTPLELQAEEPTVDVQVPVQYSIDGVVMEDEAVLAHEELRAYVFVNDGIDWSYYGEADNYVDGIYHLNLPTEGVISYVLNMDTPVDTYQKFMHFDNEVAIDIVADTSEVVVDDSNPVISLNVEVQYSINGKILSDEQVLDNGDLRAYLFVNDGTDWSYYGEADNYVNGVYQLELPIEGVESYVLNMDGLEETLQKYITIERPVNLEIEVDITEVVIVGTGDIEVIEVPVAYTINSNLLSDEQVLNNEDLRAYVFAYDGENWAYYGEADDYVGGSYYLSLDTEGYERFVLNLDGLEDEIQKFIHITEPDYFDEGLLLGAGKYKDSNKVKGHFLMSVYSDSEEAEGVMIVSLKKEGMLFVAESFEMFIVDESKVFIEGVGYTSDSCDECTFKFFYDNETGLFNLEVTDGDDNVIVNLVDSKIKSGSMELTE